MMKLAACFNLLLFSTCFMSACNLAKPVEAKSSFAYKFSDGSCSTNEKIFSTLEAMCLSLKNEAANNFCANSERYQKFQNECPGYQW